LPASGPELTLEPSMEPSTDSPELVEAAQESLRSA
jgi:hypothetical protein